MERTPETTAAQALEAARHFLTRWSDPFTRRNVDDLVQEAVIEALRCSGTLRRADRWGSFVRTIARRQRHRAATLAARSPLVGLETGSTGLIGEQLVAEEVPVEHLRIADRAMPVNWCIDELEVVLPRLGALNESIVRSYYEGFSCGELAARYGMPEEIVKVRLHRSRRRIRLEFEGRVGQLGLDAAPSCVDLEKEGES